MKRLILSVFLTLIIATLAHAQADSTGQTITLSNAVAVSGNGSTISTERWGAVRVNVTISASDTVAFQIYNGSAYVTTSNAFNVADPATAVSGATATGTFIVITNGANFRAPVTHVSGTTSVVATQIFITTAKAGGGGGSLSANSFWDAAGDLAVGTGANTAARLPIGTANQFLQVNGDATGLEWATLAGGGDALVADPLSQFAATTSAQLAGVITNETGSSLLVYNTSPTLVTPVLGVAAATTINKVALTAPATGSTLTIADGKTLTASNTLTFTGTDSSSVAFSAGGTVAYAANNLSVFASTTSAQLAGVVSNETGSGVLVFGTSPDFTTGITIGSVAVPTISSTNTFTNKTLTASNNVLGGVTMTLGSDADGDTYYRASNVLTRLAKGTAGQVLTMNAGATAPEWAAAGGGGGTTINATDGVLPYRSNSTTFADSPLTRTSSSLITSAATLLVNPAVNTNGLAVASYSLTGSNTQPALSLTGTWNTAGEAIAVFVNITDTASDAASNLIDLQIGGSSRFWVSKGGLVTSTQGFIGGNHYTGANSYFGSSGRTIFNSPSDGVITVSNNAATDFGRLQLGGTTSSYPSFKRSTTNIAVRLADDSADAGLTVGNFAASDDTPTLSDTGFANCTGLSTVSNVVTCVVSTRKVKQDFADFDNGLEAIRRIQPQTFAYKKDTIYFDNNRTHLGLIAENLQAANPLLVSLTNQTGTGLLQPEPMALHAITISAIQTLDAKITRLEREIAELKAARR